MNVSARTNLLVDAGILAGFLIAFEPGLTGLPIHEWFSLALFGTLLFHVLLHWQWVITVGGQFFRKLWHASRLNFVVDALLLLAFVTVMLSGILISRSVLTVLGIHLAVSPAWRFLHSTSANAVLLGVALHFALHWNWIVSTLKRLVFRTRRARPVSQPGPMQPAVVTVRDRDMR